jgi:hypothetical protein
VGRKTPKVESCSEIRLRGKAEGYFDELNLLDHVPFGSYLTCPFLII